MKKNLTSNKENNSSSNSCKAELLAMKLKRKQEIQAVIDIERTRIGRDLHDEIGGELTRIALLSELIQKKVNNVEDLKEDVHTIAISARKLVQAMSDIIWSLNPQNETLESLLAYIREQSQQYFEPFNIAFTISFPNEVPLIILTNAERRNLYLVTKELLHNAMQHSKAKKISLSLEISQTELCFSISDNGEGFSKRAIKVGSNGLRILKKRMQDVGGSIEWLTTSQGTLVKYSLFI
jgi:signal transduction histidine kinase